MILFVNKTDQMLSASKAMNKKDILGSGAAAYRHFQIRPYGSIRAFNMTMSSIDEGTNTISFIQLTPSRGKAFNLTFLERRFYFKHPTDKDN